MLASVFSYFIQNTLATVLILLLLGLVILHEPISHLFIKEERTENEKFEAKYFWQTLVLIPIVSVPFIWVMYRYGVFHVIPTAKAIWLMVLQFVVMVILHDTYFYWCHRLLLRSVFGIFTVFITETLTQQLLRVTYSTSLRLRLTTHSWFGLRFSPGSWLVAYTFFPRSCSLYLPSPGISTDMAQKIFCLTLSPKAGLGSGSSGRVTTWSITGREPAILSSSSPGGIGSAEQGSKKIKCNRDIMKPCGYYFPLPLRFSGACSMS